MFYCYKGISIFYPLYEEFNAIEDKIKSCDKQVQQEAKSNQVCQRLESIPGVGPITAIAFYATARESKDFSNGRHFSAWCGLAPKQHSSGGKDNLMGFSKRGNAYLRNLFIHGPRTALLHNGNKSNRFSWAIALSERREFNTACVTVANKFARMAWIIAP